MIVVAATTRGHIRTRRFKGIVAAAKALNVGREHLYLVLTGQRESPRISKAVRVVEESERIISSQGANDALGKVGRSRGKGKA